MSNERRTEGTRIVASINGVEITGVICGIVSSGPMGYTYIVNVEDSTIDKEVYPYSCVAVHEMYFLF